MIRLPAMPAWRARLLAAWGVALLFGAGVVVLSQGAWDIVPHPRPLEELSYYPSGRWLAPATLGHSESAADLAWVRAVQYYGEHRRTDNRFDHMSKVFDVLTSLAPGFVPAYVFGAFALAQEGQDFPAAEALMLKGLEANPGSGRLAFEMGFLYYVRPNGRELRRAAAMFEQASHHPDAPPQALRFAAFARQQSGDLRVAYELWENVHRESPNPYLRDIAAREMDRIHRALVNGHREMAMRRLPTPRVLLQKSR